MVSIALATYNGEQYLKEQLDSILEQSYTDIASYRGGLLYDSVLYVLRIS